MRRIKVKLLAPIVLQIQNITDNARNIFRSIFPSPTVPLQKNCVSWEQLIALPPPPSHDAIEGVEELTRRLLIRSMVMKRSEWEGRGVKEEGTPRCPPLLVAPPLPPSPDSFAKHTTGSRRVTGAPGDDESRYFTRRGDAKWGACTPTGATRCRIRKFVRERYDVLLLGSLCSPPRAGSCRSFPRFTWRDTGRFERRRIRDVASLARLRLRGDSNYYSRWVVFIILYARA